MRTPYLYQQKAIDWAIERTDSKFGYFIEMRLGKTLMTINYLKNKAPKRVLIIAPKTVCPVWERELALEGIEALPINCKTFRDLHFIIKKLPGYFVTNYETLTFTDISDCQWDAIVLDESTKIKDPRTKISQICTKNFVFVPIKIVLTGTPAPENLLDYYQQIKFLFGKVLECDSWWKFKDRFFNHSGYGKYTPKFGVKQILADYISEIAYCLKRDQVAIGSKKIYSTREVELTPEAKKSYDDFEENWLNQDFNTQWAIVAFNYLHQMAGGFPAKKEYRCEHKLAEIKELLNEDLHNEKVVIWCKYTNEIEELEKYLSIKHIVAKIDGSISQKDRPKIIDEFNKGITQVLICQIKTAAMGIDLSGSDTAIYYSNTFSSLERMQSEDRIIHPAKTSPLLFIDLITKATIDEDLYALMLEKKTNQEDFYGAVYAAMRKRHNYAPQALPMPVG